MPSAARLPGPAQRRAALASAAGRLSPAEAAGGDPLDQVPRGGSDRLLCRSPGLAEAEPGKQVVE